MLDRLFSSKRMSGLRARIGIIAAIGVALWIGFFDSHSLFRRYNWHRQADSLEEENENMRAEIDKLSEQIESGLSDDMVGEIARKEYGMHLPGETVYQVQPEH